MAYSRYARERVPAGEISYYCVVTSTGGGTCGTCDGALNWEGFAMFLLRIPVLGKSTGDVAL